MEPSDTTGGKITSDVRLLDGATLLALLIIVVEILVSIGAYPFLPALVPSHWDAAGQVNGTMPKWLNALLFPGMSLFLFLVLRGAMQIGPTLGQASSKRANKTIVNLILVGILLFMLVIQLTTTAIALGVPVDITFIISLALSALFIFLGNFMGKLRRNFWAGIRTPWTIASETVWERTHRLAGWLFVLAGLAGLATSFVPFLRIWGLVAAIMLACFIPVGYSYYAYQRYTVDGREPLSPPFDGGGDVD
jgi:immunity protein, SdpI family